MFLHKTLEFKVIYMRIDQAITFTETPRVYIYIYIYTHTHIHTYIYIYLLIYYLPAFTVTKKKKKKTRQNSEVTNLESLPGEKRKRLSGEKKRKGQLRHTSWKKSRDMQSVGQKNKNPPQKAAMLQLQKVLNTK